MTDATTPTPKPTPLERGEQVNSKRGRDARFDEEISDWGGCECMR